MFFTKLSTIVLFLSSKATSFKYDDLQAGKCPFGPGEIQADKIDPMILVGGWINVFDRNMLNEHLKCYSARFVDFNPDRDFEDEDDRTAKYFEYSTVSTDNTP
jgi:hypothetical protein